MYWGFIAAGGVILLLAVMLWFARKAGSDAVEAAIGEGNLEAAKRIAEAGANAPRSRDDLVARLRDGGGL